DEILFHPQPELMIARVEECLPETGRASKVHLKDRDPAVGQELNDRIEELAAVAEPRAAVREEDEREILRGLAGRRRQVADERKAVARLDHYPLLLRERELLERGDVGEEQRRLVRWPIVQIVASRSVVDEPSDDPTLFALVAVHHQPRALPELVEARE